MAQPYNRTHPTPHRAARQPIKIIQLAGCGYLWLTRLIKSELKIQKKILGRKNPNGTEAMMARRRVSECEGVLERMGKGKIVFVTTNADEDQ